MLFACDDPDCIFTSQDKIGVRFRNINNGNNLNIRINTLQIVGSDSILVLNNTSINNVILPINPADTAITAVFDTQFGIDTLIIGYKSLARLISEDCGGEIVYRGLYIIRSDFDSTRVVRPNLQRNFSEPTAVDENIQIIL